ncbi:MAG: hypothetical protein NDP13_05310 [Crenarchaeota archaeon]|nr:hypothetical protein [Thermoproteota archaeon]MCR8455491.1 hypothetical protein [Thermoproteota archaeon]MCR8463731.1 hypothetical protein [Thermoproteota archaeon]
MQDTNRNKSLIIAFPSDLSFPIHYYPEDNETAIFAQILAALLLNLTVLDNTERNSSDAILNELVRHLQNRKASLHPESGIALILPNDYRNHLNNLYILKRALETAGIPLHIELWGNFKEDKNVVLFAMDANLKDKNEIKKLVSRIKDKLNEWTLSVDTSDYKTWSEAFGLA